MQIQYSTTETCSSQLLTNGLLFQSNPRDVKIDPPDNTGGGGSADPEPEEPPDEEEAPEAKNQS